MLSGSIGPERHQLSGRNSIRKTALASYLSFFNQALTKPSFWVQTLMLSPLICCKAEGKKKISFCAITRLLKWWQRGQTCRLTADEKEKSSRSPAAARSDGAMSLCVASGALVLLQLNEDTLCPRGYLSDQRPWRSVWGLVQRQTSHSLSWDRAVTQRIVNDHFPDVKSVIDDFNSTFSFQPRRIWHIILCFNLKWFQGF